MKYVLKIGIFLILCIISTSLFGQQRQGGSPRQPAPVKTGPEVGEKIPDFSLVDQHGNTRTLENIAGPKGALIFFFRSADW